jgi:hypothetical protein
MSSPTDSLLYPGPDGPEGWRLSATGSSVPDPNAKRQPKWVALPNQNTLSLPVRLTSTDRAQQSGSIQLELEAAGISAAELTEHRFDILPADPTGKDDLAAVFWIDGNETPGTDTARTLDSQFAPAAAFHPLQPRTIHLWQESTIWFLAIPHSSGSLLHFQALCSKTLDADAAAEIQCILAGLEINDTLPPLDQIEVELPEDAPPIDSSFPPNAPFPVTRSQPRPPQAARGSYQLLPDAIVEARDNRRRQRTLIATLSITALLLLTGLGTFAAALYMRDQNVSQELISLNRQEPQLQKIRNAQIQFTTLDPTLNRDQFIVEIFYQLINLLPAEGIRILRFDIRADTISIDGEASSELDAINFRGEITTSEFFKGYGFDQGFVRQPPTPDGRSTFRAEGRLRPAEEDSELTASS